MIFFRLSLIIDSLHRRDIFIFPFNLDYHSLFHFILSFTHYHQSSEQMNDCIISKNDSLLLLSLILLLYSRLVRRQYHDHNNNHYHHYYFYLIIIIRKKFMLSWSILRSFTQTARDYVKSKLLIKITTILSTKHIYA